MYRACPFFLNYFLFIELCDLYKLSSRNIYCFYVYSIFFNFVCLSMLSSSNEILLRSVVQVTLCHTQTSEKWARLIIGSLLYQRQHHIGDLLQKHHLDSADLLFSLSTRRISRYETSQVLWLQIAFSQFLHFYILIVSIILTLSLAFLPNN